MASDPLVGTPPRDARRSCVRTIADNGIQPEFGETFVAQFGRVHAIFGERCSTELESLPGQFDVGRYQNRVIALRELPDDLDFRVEVATPRLLLFGDGQQERFDEH